MSTTTGVLVSGGFALFLLVVLVLVRLRRPRRTRFFLLIMSHDARDLFRDAQEPPPPTDEGQ